MKIKKLDNENWVYFNFKKSLVYIKEIKNYILFIVYLFILFILIGFFYQPDSLAQFVMRSLQEIVKKTENLGLFELIRFIIINNSQTSFFGVVFGVFFSFFPVIEVVINGYLLGFVSRLAINEGGILVLWRLLPHGIFELPAVIISLAMGVRLGSFMFSARDKSKSMISFVLSFFIIIITFLFFYSFFALIFLGVSFGPDFYTNPGDFSTNYQEVLGNPFVSLFFITLFFVLFVSGINIGLRIFSKKDRKEIIKKLKSDFVNSMRVFLFVVIPLLVVAGIIEGFLIYLTSV